MARDDYERRRLRALYERNKQRVSAMADARDRRRDDPREMPAPRRFILSENRTRSEGFGRGGLQVRHVVRRAVRELLEGRFADRGVFRRGNRDRFRRDEDVDRELRRERFRGGRGAGGRRFGVSRRQRLQFRDRDDRKGRHLTRGGGRSNNGGRGGGNNPSHKNQKDTNQGRANGNKGNQRRGGNGGRGREQQLTREQLDAQLEKFRNN